MTTSDVSYSALRGEVNAAQKDYAHTALSADAEAFVYKATTVPRKDFDVRNLVVETIRDPFSRYKYSSLPSDLRRKLNLTVAILQCIFISGPAFLYMAMPSGSDTSCVYSVAEQIPLAVVTKEDNSTDGGYRARLSFAHSLDRKVANGWGKAAWTSVDAHKDWESTRYRGKDICTMLQEASLARREDTSRDYLGPFVERTVDFSKKPICGYWSGPDESYNGVDQAYWIKAFKSINDTGAHYGRVPQLSRDRPHSAQNMIKDNDKFFHVCVMKPIKVTVFGTEGALTVSISLLIIAYCGVYVFGPASHSNTLFTLSYVGTVNIAGTATMMLSFLVNCFAVWVLEKIICYKYKSEMKPTAPVDE